MPKKSSDRPNRFAVLGFVLITVYVTTYALARNTDYLTYRPSGYMLTTSGCYPVAPGSVVRIPDKHNYSDYSHSIVFSPLSFSEDAFRRVFSVYPNGWVTH